MTTSEFWDLYLNKPSLSIFDETYKFFSKELPEEFLEEYDVEEVLIETKSHQESNKNFDNVLKFTALIQENHQDLYLDVFEYFDDFLVDYYCYQGKEDKLKEAFANFQAFPLKNLDQYLLAFNKLVYYQQTEIIKESVFENFIKINESIDSFGNPEFDLASFVYCSTLQKLYLDGPGALDRDHFSNKLSEFNFEFNKDTLDFIEKGLFNPHIESDRLTELFQREKRNTLHLIEMYFLRHMYKKGFEFYLADDIWNHMKRYWMRDDYHVDISSHSYFGSTASSFEDYLFKHFSSFLIDNTAEIILALWGSVYVYEFLFQLGLISQEDFDHFLTISRKMKGQVIGFYPDRLWDANFVHHWEKPECISETEFRAEEKIFHKCINLTAHDSMKLLEHIQDELSSIGPLANDIKEGVAKDERGRNMSHKDILNDDFLTEYPKDKSLVRTEKKVGRNEPCPCGSGQKYKKCCGKK